MKKITIHYGQFIADQYPEGINITFEQLMTYFTLPAIRKHVFRYQQVSFCCDNIKQVPRVFLILLMCKLLTVRKVTVIGQDNSFNCGWLTVIAEGWQYIKEIIRYRSDYRFHQRILASLQHEDGGELKVSDIKGEVLYIRGNLPSGLVSGGSVTHALGVINNIHKFSGTWPTVLSLDQIEGIDGHIGKYFIKDSFPYRNIKGYTAVAVNSILYDRLQTVASDHHFSFIYQRYSINCYAGIRYAREHKIPFVLEFNSSEVWTQSNWGRGKDRYMDFARKAEQLLLEKSTIITCVSKVLKDQLIHRGIAEEKILVNYNAVDTDKYNPSIDGNKIRGRYGISEDKVVIAFIGTFGKWHGAAVLAKAFVQCAARNQKLHLLLIGNGGQMAAVKDILSKGKVGGRYTLTGFVEQEKGAEYLAAGDILVSPTVRNPDGTPFFGSPTKIFEYMAMGKAIVASRLDQLAEVITDQYTGLLCEPGDIEELSKALLILSENKALRNSLGQAARIKVCNEHTWEKHVERIFIKLKEITMSF